MQDNKRKTLWIYNFFNIKVVFYYYEKIVSQRVYIQMLVDLKMKRKDAKRRRWKSKV
jgi:hypothetical protein